jgi:hypothetical protein
VGCAVGGFRLRPSTGGEGAVPGRGVLDPAGDPVVTPPLVDASFLQRSVVRRRDTRYRIPVRLSRRRPRRPDETPSVGGPSPRDRSDRE